MEEMLLNIIDKVGFPIFVAVWFLYRTDKRLEEVTATLAKLSATVELLLREVDDPPESDEGQRRTVEGEKS